MTISGTLSAALSGLNVAAHRAEIVSSNIANATTEGYGRRELQTATRVIGSIGQGVHVTGVLRISDPVLLADRRSAEAGAGDRQARAAFHVRLEAAIGTPEDAASLTGRIAVFDRSLIEAASRPESEARLSAVAEAARRLVEHLAIASDEVQTTRADADARIDADVGKLNATLSRIAELNGLIRTNTGVGRDSGALVDQRQQLIDSVSAIVPLREVQRENGQIALYTTGGATLLDGTPALIGFTPVGIVLPEMTLGSGGLSGLTINGRPVATSGDASPMRGGTLAAQFALRDQLAPEAQARLDAVARDLAERFADPALDASRAPGAPGLFTDAGGAVLAANEVGLARRLSLNALADPQQGGALWRLRDGLGATTPGAPGNAALLADLQAALAAPRSPVSGGFMTGARGFATLAADLLSGVSSARLAAQNEASFATARAATLNILALEDGVDTDQEMQTLLMIEQAYAANAKVVQTVDEMIKLLLGM